MSSFWGTGPPRGRSFPKLLEFLPKIDRIREMIFFRARFVDYMTFLLCAAVFRLLDPAASLESSSGSIANLGELLNDPVTRTSLILRLSCADNEAAWGEFVRIYQPLIMRAAIRMGLSRMDAEEATQEVLIQLTQVVEQWSSDPPGATFRGWLYRVSRHVIIRFIQQKGRLERFTPQSVRSELDHQPAPASLESAYFDLQFRQQVFSYVAHKIRDTFAEKNWRAFWRSYVEYQSIPDTAAELGMRVCDVYVARSRILKRFQSEIKTLVDNEWDTFERVQVDQLALSGELLSFTPDVNCRSD